MKQATITVRQGLFKTVETFDIEYQWPKEKQARIDQHLRKNYHPSLLQFARFQNQYGSEDVTIIL